MRMPNARAGFRLCVIAAMCLWATPMAAWGRAADKSASIADSVVKVHVFSNPPDLAAPWQSLGVEESGGSGVIIEGQRVLTNAHVVDAAVAIELKRAGGSVSYPARVAFISHEADLAMLTVEDAGFFRGTRPIRLGQMPKLEQAVTAYGFPIGGDTLSLTSGIVSRIEVDRYSQAMEELLAVQIDAAINPGNSGGPVVSKGAMVGIAMQTLSAADNVGYIIPIAVVRHFLNDVADGRYDGFPRLGVQFQDMESPAQRRAAGMREGQTGALVARVDYGGPGDGVLRRGDVLLAIEGQSIANDLTLVWPGLGRVEFPAAYRNKQVGEAVSLELLRDGKTVRESVRLTAQPALVPGRRLYARPQYLVFAGLLFQPLTLDYLREYEGLPPSLYSRAYYENHVTAERRQILLLQTVLPHSVNRGYQSWTDEIVERVNGVVPRDMEHLASLIDGARGPWLRIETQDGSLLTLDLAKCRAAHEEILDVYGIEPDRMLDAQASKPKRRGRRKAPSR
jgi:S1-C subfamily serine protease